jgi:hypothetical protein
MPIHINLLAEAQAAEELRRRDPVKRAIFVGISLVAVALMWSGMVEVNLVLAREHLAGVQTVVNARTNAYQRAMSDQGKNNPLQKKLAALQKLQASRFLYGSLLNALQHATVDGVQLTRLRVDQSYFLTEGTDAQTNEDRVIPGHPGTVKERVVVHLEARDFSPNPGDQVNNFKDAIAKEPVYFARLLDKTNGVQLANPPSSPQNDAAKPYVTFMLDCRFPEVTR